jgi:hypothetical protein
MDKISCCKKRDDCLLENTLPKVIVTCGYKWLKSCLLSMLSYYNHSYCDCRLCAAIMKE